MKVAEAQAEMHVICRYTKYFAFNDKCCDQLELTCVEALSTNGKTAPLGGQSHDFFPYLPLELTVGDPALAL